MTKQYLILVTFYFLSVQVFSQDTLVLHHQKKNELKTKIVLNSDEIIVKFKKGGRSKAIIQELKKDTIVLGLLRFDKKDSLQRIALDKYLESQENELYRQEYLNLFYPTKEQRSISEIKYFIVCRECFTSGKNNVAKLSGWAMLVSSVGFITGLIIEDEKLLFGSTGVFFGSILVFKLSTEKKLKLKKWKVVNEIE